MIAYIRAWQNVLNEVAKQNDLIAFEFNTYIISVLVIFYLQMNHGWPTISGLVTTRGASGSEEDLGKYLNGFFQFYGKKYEIPIHLISVNIGRWQEKRLQPKQNQFSSEQKRYVYTLYFNTP